MNTFTYAELFGGILGFGTAFDRIGGSPVFISEIDKHAQTAIKALGRADVLHGDITQVDAADVPQHDILVGGFPCQSFSLQGSRRGFNDTRGTLIFEVLRIAKEQQPAMILLENVKGLTNHDKGNTISTMLHAINDVGYLVDFKVLSSLNYGVPQKRERVFIVAIRKDLHAASTWTEDVDGKNKIPTLRRELMKDGLQTFNFDWPVPNAITPKLSSIMEKTPDRNLYLPSEKVGELIYKLRDRELAQIEQSPIDAVMPFIAPDRINKTINGSRIGSHEDAANTLTVMDRHGVLEGLPIREATKQGYAMAYEGDCVNFAFPKSKTRRGRVSRECSNTLIASDCSHGIVEKQGEFFTIRRFSTLEAFRLQGFSDEHHDIIAAAGVSTLQRYKQAGNAVSVPVIEAIGRQMTQYLPQQQPVPNAA